jgi:hypothetical protein
MNAVSYSMKEVGAVPHPVIVAVHVNVHGVAVRKSVTVVYSSLVPQAKTAKAKAREDVPQPNPKHRQRRPQVSLQRTEERRSLSRTLLK